MTPPDHDSYSEFALVYDAALGRRFFRTVSGLVDRSLDKHSVAAGSHLDVACGTGLALEHLARKGFSPVGIDASLSMLAIARRRAPRLLACDMRSIALRGRFSLITCLYDSLNHLLSRADLVAAFRSIASLMGGSSLFLFDVNHPDAYPRVWALADPFVAANATYRLAIDTTWSEEEGIGTGRVTGWLSLGGAKVLIDEEHRQRPYSEAEIVASLQDAGLKALEMIPFDPFDENDGEAKLKMFFVARRVGAKHCARQGASRRPE